MADRSEFDSLTPEQRDWFIKINKKPTRIPRLIIDGVLGSVLSSQSKADDPGTELKRNFRIAKKLSQ